MHCAPVVPEWAPWTPNVILGIAGLALIAWRSRSADQPMRVNWSGLRPWKRRADQADAVASGAVAAGPSTESPARRPLFDLAFPKTLDVYLSRQYLRILSLGLVSLLGLFYISTFIDLVDKLLRGEATLGMLLRYFYFQTPQFVYWIIPMGVLVSTLVTVGVMTKNGELLVMRACGIDRKSTRLNSSH